MTHPERETGGLCEEYAESLIDFLHSLPVEGNVVFRSEVRPREWVIDRVVAQIERFTASPEASSTVRAQAAELERLRGALEQVDGYARKAASMAAAGYRVTAERVAEDIYKISTRALKTEGTSNDG